MNNTIKSILSFIILYIAVVYISKDSHDLCVSIFYTTLKEIYQGVIVVL